MPTLTPTIGRTVLVLGHEANDSDVHPAVITRVWTRSMINVTAFPDMESPKIFISIQLCENEDEARSIIGPGRVVAFWPPLT